MQLAFTTDAYKLVAEFRDISVKAQAAFPNALQEAAMVMESGVKGICPVKTGALRASIGTSIVGDTATIGATAKHAPFIEYGTRAHGPVTAKFLRFEIGGKVIYAKWVKGIQAQYIFKKTFNEKRTEIAKKFADLVTKAYL